MADITAIIDKGYDLIFCPSFMEANEFMCSSAYADKRGAFGSLITTIRAWAAKLWELEGDGRIFTDTVQRHLLLVRALDESAGNALEIHPHLVNVIAKNIKRVAGLSSYDDLLTCVTTGDFAQSQVDLIPEEQELLCSLIRYEELALEYGLIEEGRALAWLSSHADEVLTHELCACYVGDAPFSAIESQFIDALLATGKFTLDRYDRNFEAVSYTHEQSIRPAPATTQLNFAFPSGAYAQPQLVVELILSIAPTQNQQLVIAAKDPEALFESIEPALTKNDIHCSLSCRHKIQKTDVGKACLNLYELLNSNDLLWDRAALSDVLALPITGFGFTTQWFNDKTMRENRLLACDQLVETLCENEQFAALVALIREADTSGLTCLYERIDAIYGQRPLNCTLEHNALSLLAHIMQEQQRLGLEGTQRVARMTNMLCELAVPVSYANYELTLGEAPACSIMSFAEAATRMPKSCATMVVLDLDSESYPSAMRDDAIALLFKRAHIPQGEAYLARMRRLFNALVEAPTTRLVLSRCLNNDKAEARYPCALLEEFVDCYRVDLSQTDDIDNIYGLPAHLQKGKITAGEEQLFLDVAAGQKEPELVASVASMDKHEAAKLVVHPKGTSYTNAQVQTQAQVQLVLSPSQIETYLSCPRKWLATRRIASGSIDEEFSQREFGNYRHDVLMRFYQLYQEKLGPKLVEDKLTEAKSILKQACKETREAHLTKGIGRFAPFPHSTETFLVKELDEELELWLEKELSFMPAHLAQGGTEMLPSFMPHAFEFDIAPYSIEYAGAQLTGRIDRIDTNNKLKQALIIDYKGNVTTDYDQPINSKTKAPELDLSHKVQGLIYASALEKSPDLRVALGLTEKGPATAGALYMSYHQNGYVRGVYCSDIIDRAAQIPTMSSTNQGLAIEDYHALLAQLEEEIHSHVVEPLLAGDTEARPTGNACKWCPLSGCKARRAAHGA